MVTKKQNEPFVPEHFLLQRARAGESRAFDDLFVQHKDGVYACLWHLLGADADQVEEAVGAVFLNAYRSLGRFRGDSTFSTWLYRIAINEAHARIRQRRRRRFFAWIPLHGPNTPNVAAPEALDPAKQFLSAEEDRMLWKAVRALPEPYRTPVVLRYMSGMDSSEIAGVLKRPNGTIRYQLSRALRILRERLGNEWIK